MINRARETVFVTPKEIVVKHHDVSLVIDDECNVTIEDNYGDEFNTIGWLTNDEIKALIKFLQERVV